ncbi:MAG: hypothetical protein P9X24_08815 [Candidatus Hatepunaea meridiana]|nr:hypothetical protein [Candidatus Hatepunaea meridiana]
MRVKPIDVSPRKIFQEVADAIPSESHGNIIIVGSLAAGYHLLNEDSEMQVRTKDVDCVLSPHYKAVLSGRTVAESLLTAGWQPFREGSFSEPGTAETPDDMLPVVRLCPPNSKSWFLELLTEPATPNQTNRHFERLVLSTGHYGLPSFRFTTLATFNAEMTEFGFRCARPEMMVLANLLENPKIKPVTISGSDFEGHEIKRSNKDLGRVLTIARLSSHEVMESWPDAWEEAFRNCFPDEWQRLAASTGSGLRELLNSELDFQEVYFTCINSFLASRGVTPEQLKSTGERLLIFTIELFEERGK